MSIVAASVYRNGKQIGPVPRISRSAVQPIGFFAARLIKSA
jgi:hypothetical protein